MEDIINKLIKNVKLEKQLLLRLINDEKYSQEIINELKYLYKETSLNTTSLIEILLKSKKTPNEIYEKIDSITSQITDKEESIIINMNLKQLIKEQISTHRYINLPTKNNFEFQGAIRSIEGEYMLILYSLSKDLLSKAETRKDKEQILKAIVNKFLSDYSIKYYLMGEEKLAEKFCNPQLYFDDNMIEYLLTSYDQKIDKFLSLIKTTYFLYFNSPSNNAKKTADNMNKFSQLYLTAQFIQFRKNGHIPKIDYENLSELDKKIISDSVTNSMKFCDEHQINNEHVYKKTR